MSTRRVPWCGRPIWYCPICGTGHIWPKSDQPPKGCMCGPWEERVDDERTPMTWDERKRADALLASVFAPTGGDGTHGR